MRLIYLTAPLSAPTKEGIKANIERAKRWYRWIATTFEVGVIADWIIMCEVLDDHNPDDRAYGLDVNAEAIRRCDEIWNVGGAITKGCEFENAIAEQVNKRRADLTFLGPEPPVGHAPPEVVHLLAPLRKVRVPQPPAVEALLPRLIPGEQWVTADTPYVETVTTGNTSVEKK